jgi:SAM-dependent methyltransferase
MEKEAFALLERIEDSWWYRGREKMIRSALARTRARGTSALDFGAGYGGMQHALSAYFPRVSAFEPESSARDSLASRGYVRLYVSQEEAFANTFDCIGAFDVVEHLEDDRAFLTAAHRALAPGGILAITVPAFPFLWSAHDVNHHHFRRYRRQSLKRLLAECGYTVEYASYWNFALFVPAATLRLLGKTGASGLALPRMLDSLFFAIVYAESLIARLIPLPWGTGLVVIARKQ